jgi:hypothetical protein
MPKTSDAAPAPPPAGEVVGAPSPTRALWIGILVWVLVSVAAVAVRGVRWDDNYLYAQVNVGEIVYPDGHPTAQFVLGVYSLQTHALAALLRLGAGPLVANGLRNVLFLLATVLPVFTLAVVLTRRAVWGHAAAVLVLLGVHARLFSTYPIQTWPEVFSTGHVGTGWALMAVALWVGGYRRIAYFMLGLMASVHLGQLPPLLALLALGLVQAWRQRRLDELRAAAVWAGIGFAISAALWVHVQSLTVPPPVDGPYYSAIDPEVVWKRFTVHHDDHRSLPWTTGQLALLGLLLLTAARARDEWRRGLRPGPWGWLTAYGLLCGGAVWTVMAVHATMGADVPFLLISWMPYRLLNHAAILLVPVTLACLGERGAHAGPSWVAVGVLAAAVVLLITGGPLKTEPLGPGPVTFLEAGDGLLFVLYGAALAVAALAVLDERRFAIPWAGVVAAAVLSLTVTYPACLETSVGEGYVRVLVSRYTTLFVPACILGGFVLAVLLDGRKPRVSSAVPGAVLCVVALAVLGVQQGRAREPLPVTAFERRVVRTLEERGEADAMILAPHQQETLQARLGHPIMTDLAAFNWIPYKPSLGPAQHKMYEDLFGIDFAPEPGEAAYPGGAWEDYPERRVWPSRTRDEWRRLGAEYGFRYVIARDRPPLDLEPLFSADGHTLYRVPSEGDGRP